MRFAPDQLNRLTGIAVGGCALATILAGLLAAPQAAAQTAATQPVEPEPAPVQPDEAADAATPQAGRGLTFDELSFDIGFDAEWRRRRTDSQTTSAYPSRYRLRSTYRSFEETAGATASGSLIDERVLNFDLSGRWGVSQERFHEARPGRDLLDTPHGDLLQYDARVSLFPAGKLSANVFASQGDDRLPRAFLPSLDRRRERYGAELEIGRAHV